MTGFVVFAHGSRIESANAAVRDVAAQLAESGRYPVEAAFLELGEPSLQGAVQRLLRQSVSRIVVIPYFLTLGTHLQRDLPKLVRDSVREHGSVDIDVTPPLDGHPALLQILLDRARTALDRSPEAV